MQLCYSLAMYTPVTSSFFPLGIVTAHVDTVHSLELTEHAGSFSEIITQFDVGNFHGYGALLSEKYVI